MPHRAVTAKWKPNGESQRALGERGQWKAALVKCSQSDLLVFQFPVFCTYVGLKTLFYLYTVICRSYEGTLLAFNCSIHTPGYENIFSLI